MNDDALDFDAGETTKLVLSGMGIPLYSARGLRQSLTPIEEVVRLRRLADGSIINTAAPQMRLYQSTISGTDQQAPAFDGVFPGAILVVDCIVKLSTEQSTAGLQRTAVPGSEYQEDGFSFYRPRLNMVVANFTVERDEYDQQISWQLDLLEIGGDQVTA